MLSTAWTLVRGRQWYHGSIEDIPMKIAWFGVPFVTSVCALAADGRNVPAGQEQAVVTAHLAAPEHYDIFHGKRDRQYLTGLWKLKWEWNYLTSAWIKENMRKPVVGFVAGLTAPKGRRMGHAGAIISAAGDSAAEKAEIMRANGLTVAPNPSEFGSTVAQVLGL